MTLVSEAERVHAKAVEKDKRERAKRGKETVKRLRAGFKYRFNVFPDEIVREGSRYVAVKDGIKFVENYAHSSVSGWHVLATCPDCGNEYIARGDLGSLKDHYGGRFEKTPRERRARAVTALGKVLARGGRPERIAAEHECFDGSTARVLAVAKAEAERLKTSAYDLLSRALDEAGR